VFFGGSLLIIAGFLGGVMLILNQNFGYPPPDAGELQQGLPVMLGFIGLGLAADTLRIESLPVSAVQARVDANFSRWVFFWILGFFGVGGSILLGAPGAVFSFFVGLKAFWELGSLFDRAVAAAKPAGAPDTIRPHTHPTDELPSATDAPPAPPPPVDPQHRVERTR
jgi:hypothetical protein